MELYSMTMTARTLFPLSKLRTFGAGMRSLRLGPALVTASALALLAGPAFAQQGPATATAIEQMQVPGPEAQALAKRAGLWDVTITFRPSPEAKPIVSDGLIAERKMVGLFLEETIKPGPGSSQADFRRISYLTYSRVEGRWQYVSLDTRFPAGLMPAYSPDRGVDGKITFQFESLAFAGFGQNVEGWMLRSDYVILPHTDDVEVAQQHWTRADGSERHWLAVEYRYTRHHR
jgi:hypothetical protein